MVASSSPKVVWAISSSTTTARPRMPTALVARLTGRLAGVVATR